MSKKNEREKRLEVIENIRNALSDGDSFRKVEVGDPVIDESDIARVVWPFENIRRKRLSKFKACLARGVAQIFTHAVNRDTEILGIENALSVKGGAMITSNHYNPTDSTPPRMVAKACGKKKNFHIVIQERNLFMKGLFGFLMRNCNTMPVTKSPSYMAKNFGPAITEILKGGGFVLIYPEQEMWYNYKKPREHRDGAYHYAASAGVPIIPMFCEMRNIEGEYDKCGFLKVKHILHILPPIYPDENLSVRENRINMHKKDTEARAALYEKIYGKSVSEPFDVRNDIAGFVGL